MQTPTATYPRLPWHEACGNHIPTYGENHVAEKWIEKAIPALVLADDCGTGVCRAAGCCGETVCG